MPMDMDDVERKRIQAERTKRRTEKKIAAGLCGSCGKNPLFTKRLCEGCYSRNRPISDAITNARRSNYRATGFCGCGKERLPNKKLCQVCSDRSKAADQKSNAKRDAKGLCRRCGKFPKRNADSPGSYCQMCCLKAVCKITLGDVSRASEMLELFNKQEGICPYTGMPLVIGETASIDHKIPTSQGGDHSIENLQWIHRWANFAKADYSEEEFLQFIFAVASRKSAH